jgi:hypothetical protein
MKSIFSPKSNFKFYKMSNTIKSREPNHMWTRDEIALVATAYLDGKSVKEAHALVPEIKITSVKTKYADCLHLDKSVNRRFKNVSKVLEEVLNELKSARTKPDVDEVAEPEPSGWDEEPEEDGETYFMCEGTCGRVMHYEDTNEFQMCGRCEHESQKKGRRK